MLLRRRLPRPAEVRPPLVHPDRPLRPLSLILDHANGVRDDNRLENLRIVCPNCNATLDTHCGRNATLLTDRECAHCGNRFRPRFGRQRYCSHATAAAGGTVAAGRTRRCVASSAPPFDRLLAEIAELGYTGVGRRYGVSDNAVRKWVAWYEREAAANAQAADASASTTRSMRTRPA